MQVPEEWGVKLLEDISDKVMVGIASAATHAYSNSGIIMLRNLNIKEGWIDDSDILYITPEYEKSHRNKRLKAGDILTVRTGYPGVSAVVSEKYNNAQCFTSLITRLKQNIAKPEFVCLYINSDYGKRFITSGEAGGAQKNVNAGMLKKMPVPIPPLNVQQKIAQILSTWDKAITTTEQLLTNSQQQKKALMQQLLTGKKRLLDDNGQRFGGEWKKMLFGDVFEKISNGITYDTKATEGLPVSRIETISTGKIDYKKVGWAPDDETTKRHMLISGDILYSHINSLEHIGRVAYYDAEQPLYHGMNLLLLRLKKGFVSKFFYQLLSSEFGKRYASEYAKSAVNQASISTTDIKSFKALVPSLDEQQKIATVLTAADQETTQLQQKLDQIKQEKKALMQQLLTGKRRVLVALRI